MQHRHDNRSSRVGTRPESEGEWASLRLNGYRSAGNEANSRSFEDCADQLIVVPAPPCPGPLKTLRDHHRGTISTQIASFHACGSQAIQLRLVWKGVMREAT